jgi:conjugative transposon TraJ protein
MRITMRIIVLTLVVCGLLWPMHVAGQGGVASSINGLQPVLDGVYTEMLPLCSGLIGAAQGLAGFGALWYIAARVWKHLAAAEPVDFYPLLRPFALGLAILLFPMVISVINGLLAPVSSATAGMVKNSNRAIDALLKQKEQAIKRSTHWQMYVGESGTGNQDRWYKYTHPEDPDREKEGMFEGIGNSMKFWMDRNFYQMKNSIKQWMSEVLQVLFAAAALCINTVRTFYLVVLAILGPLVFGFAVYDGFQHTLTVWLARYVNVFMWLPVANIFGSILGKIQEQMLKIDIAQIGQAGDTFFSPSDFAYLVFLCMGIVGYLTVPNVANYIVHAGGGNALLQRVNTLVTAGGSSSVQTLKSGAGMIVDRFGDTQRQTSQGMAEAQKGDYFKNKLGGEK